MKSHPIQDLLPLRLRGEELGSLDVAAEDRIRERRRGLLRPVDDDLDLAGPDLLHNVSDAIEIGVEQERLANRLVVDRRIGEANLEGPQVSLADRETAANGPEALGNPFHVVAEGQMVFEQRLQPAFEGLVVNPKQVIHERFDVNLAGVGHQLVQDPVRVRPPEPHHVLAGQELLDQVTEGDVHNLAERRMDDQEAVERLDDDPVVRWDRGAGLAVVRVLFDEALRTGLVDRPRLLEVLDGLRDTLPVKARVNLFAYPTDALGEAERDGQHLPVPAGDDRIRIGDGRHVDHAVLPDLLHLPRPTADDEVQSFAGLDHHELLAEDADLPLRREVHDRVAAFVADRREVLEVIAAALRRDADLVPFLTDGAEMGHELRDTIRLDVFDLAERFGAANRREDFGPGRRASLVERGADDLVRQDVEGEAMDVQRLEVLVPRRLDRRERFDRIVRGDREDQPSGGSIQLVA